MTSGRSIPAARTRIMSTERERHLGLRNFISEIPPEHKQLSMKLELMPAAEIAKLVDVLNLTPAGRELFLESAPRVVDVLKLGRTIRLPTGYQEMSYGDWRFWLKHYGRPDWAAVDLLYLHFNRGHEGHLSASNGYIILYNTPVTSPARLQETALHELLHVVNRQLPIDVQHHMYGALARLVKVHGQRFLESGFDPWGKEIMYDLTAATKASQHAYEQVVDPEIGFQFMRQISWHWDRPDDVWLPAGLLGRGAIYSFFDEAHALLGSQACVDLGVLEAHYRHYLDNRLQVVSHLADEQRRAQESPLTKFYQLWSKAGLVYTPRRYITQDPPQHYKDRPDAYPRHGMYIQTHEQLEQALKSVNSYRSQRQILRYLRSRIRVLLLHGIRQELRELEQQRGGPIQYPLMR